MENKKLELDTPELNELGEEEEDEEDEVKPIETKSPKELGSKDFQEFSEINDSSLGINIRLGSSVIDAIHLSEHCYNLFYSVLQLKKNKETNSETYCG